MTDAKQYDAWLVDLDGTLYHARWVKLAMAAELALLGWGALGAIRRFRHEHEHLRDLDEDLESPFHTQLSRTATALSLDPDRVESHIREWMIQRPLKWVRLFRNRPLLTEIADYRAAGGRTALVSDYPARAKLAALAGVELFDEVVASGEPGGPPRLKPHPGGYLRAAEQLGIAPERCLVIGDRADADGAAAEAAGMGFRHIR